MYVRTARSRWKMITFSILNTFANRPELPRLPHTFKCIRTGRNSERDSLARTKKVFFAAFQNVVESFPLSPYLNERYFTTHNTTKLGGSDFPSPQKFGDWDSNTTLKNVGSSRRHKREISNPIKFVSESRTLRRNVFPYPYPGSISFFHLRFLVDFHHVS